MEEKDLKIEALKGRIGELVSRYEDHVADLRVIVTKQQEELEALKQEASHPSEAEFEEGEPV